MIFEVIYMGGKMGTVRADTRALALQLAVIRTQRAEKARTVHAVDIKLVEVKNVVS